MRTWAVAVVALAASTGTTLAQDAAGGEAVFKRLCSPCHDIGEEAKIKLGPPLNGIEGRKAGTFEGFKEVVPGAVLATRLTLVDGIRKDKSSVLDYGSIVVRDIPEKYFDKNSMKSLD